MNLIKELEWRGLIQDVMLGTEEQLQKEETIGYIGFDPTSDSLHVGSLLPIFLIEHFRRAGHIPLIVIGGATGMIGDPSGKSKERNLLEQKVLDKNVENLSKQLKKLVNVEILNNYDWFKDVSFLDFIRDIGKHFTVDYMCSKDSVKKRLEDKNGISFTEFTYQLMQGYDFYWLYMHKNCKLQMGGSDQWGNILNGYQLIWRKEEKGAFAFTCPLLTKSDGSKFGKTEKGTIWLDSQKTSPYEFYQFWINISDEDAEKYIKMFTFLTQEQISFEIYTHKVAPSKRILQKRLAQELTLFVHGEEGLKEAQITTEKLFSPLSIEDHKYLEGIPKITFPKLKLNNGLDIVTLLVESNNFDSRGKARRMIEQGGITINGERITNPSKSILDTDLKNNHLLIQKGKKFYSLIEFI